MNDLPSVAFALYDGFSARDFTALYEPLAARGFRWQACARSTDVYDAHGLHFYPTCITQSLAGYDLVIVPGGPGAGDHLNSPALLTWLATAADARWLAAVSEGALLLAAAGLADGLRVAVPLELRGRLAEYGAIPVEECLVIDERLATAADARAALELAEMLCAGLPERADSPTSRPEGIPVTGAVPEPPARRATIQRKTGETQVEARLDIDGTGRHQIATGLPFLDHMLAQIAVHGLFDLYIQAQGDLHIDPHHTVEDVALTLGSAFQQALGDRAGIVRMASADCPMDESLAWAAVDFSGRPYTVLQAEWHGPSVGGLPVSLIPHFFESFAINARCNLHAAVRYGRDDHHQVEALFKAFARALCAATRIDPRRAGQVPSSKGILF